MSEQQIQVTMTQEEAQAFQAYKERRDKEEREAREMADRDAYRELSKETVDRLFPRLVELSGQLK